MGQPSPFTGGTPGCWDTTWARRTSPFSSLRDRKCLEAITITADDRNKYPDLPYQYKHRETLVWTSKFRPRNDINMTVPNSINNWLKK